MMKKSTFLALFFIGTAVTGAKASIADDFEIPVADASERVGAIMPYTRYDSEEAALGGGARLLSSPKVAHSEIAAQASNRSYVTLPSAGAYAEWTMRSTGRGVTMRFTMPDSPNGMGLQGSLDIYVNNEKVHTADLTSYFMWQYFDLGGGHPSDTPGGNAPCFAFDEVHFMLPKALKKDDKIRVQSSGANSLEYGVDFIEIEEVPAPLEPEGDYVSVLDYGAVANDGRDDMDAFLKALAAADNGCKVMYIPEGTYHLNRIWDVRCENVKIMGAGIWYTNIQFTNSNKQSGGISGGNGYGNTGNPKFDGYCNNVEFCHMYINSNLRSRYAQEAVYKCFMDVWREGSVIHDIWEEHFECGFWLGDYNGNTDYSENLKIVNCRIRNNLADGVNFCQGTSNSTVYNCNIRNCGDDGLAIWNNNAHNVDRDETNNVFAYNTIDFIWRAGGIAIYGGDGHKVYNNYIRDTYMASGIHLNSQFDGYKYDNTKLITFENNILVGCGTAHASWNDDLAAIDVTQNVKNVKFINTQIYDSPFDALRCRDNIQNIVFDGLKIYGAGLTGEAIEWSCVKHSACAMRFDCEPSQVSFNNLSICNVAPNNSSIGRNETWPFWTDNNADKANAIKSSQGYEYLSDVSYLVPGYPDPENPQNGGVVDPIEGIYDYNLKLTGLAWAKDDRAAGELSEGENIVFSIRIDNDSDVDIPVDTRIEAQIIIDGKTTLTIPVYKGGLEAGANIVLSTSAWQATPGAHEVVAVCDYRDRLPDETDETDNSRSKKFNVAENPEAPLTFDPVAGGFDFKVLDIRYQRVDANGNFIDPTPGKGVANVGDRLVFTAIVVNRGDQNAPRGSKLGVQFQVNGVDYSTGLITWADQHYDGLASHQMVALTANGGGGQSQVNGPKYWTATNGQNNITAWVNDTPNAGYSNEMNSSETDNKLTVSFTFPNEGIKYHDDPDLPDNLFFSTGDVDNITIDDEYVDPCWYTLTGLRFEEKPSTPGIYIHAGKKVLIR